ncbi:MAG: MoaD/ThiS family protein [Deltaproteobacteria bacterium]|jgi:molybdopterin converting factor small subunit|nr:MoaD/ThiS family protein [Deltaproteobacteria bacterium]
MEVKVKLFATLRDYLPKGSDGKSCQMEIDEKMTIEQIIAQLKIPEEIPKIILVNGLQGSMDQTLKEGDVLSIFPPVAGG